MLQVSELYIYPVKSLGGIAVNSAALTDRGFEYDRRWMLVDHENRFFTQREIPQMALLQIALSKEGLTVRPKHQINNSLFIPYEPENEETCTVTVWDDQCDARFVSSQADEWFSEMLSTPCRLVYMPDTTQRLVDTRYAHNLEITSFADGYPLLLIGQASLDDLNQRLSSPVPMNRFRPNIVFTGGTPYQEDEMKSFSIAGVSFSGVKPCARCPIPTIDQDTAARGKEPLATFSLYRRRENNVYFGQNLLFNGAGRITVGDIISLE